ncbi:acetate--CoA ligase family protein [Amycolatopsis taiwanensis]|uniref:CoA-binding protein n=1 Tax=Amycolatopsis taiwanensis TaxID=342230 RepID=A0A9W6QXH3_9PSEU|nr:acetate--CoA ligase [Amycolatopsis taiwanensis]GLY65846.1 CoA-binding protein [Amycolatopsis taiwanensis]
MTTVQRAAGPVSAAANGARHDPLERMFDPRSIAVVGASTDPGKRGYQAIRALIDAGYPYPIYPVNPKGGNLLGLTVLPHVSHLPAGVDVALIATPAQTVPRVLRACASAGVAGAVVLANGFRESGPSGIELEEELREVVAATGIRVVGPNTSGILNVSGGANLVGLPDVPPGPISVIAQSGNMLLSLVAESRAARGPGFDTYIGLGNQSDVRYDECIAYLARRETTGAIAVHSEGFRHGRELIATLADVTRHRPVVMLRGGRSEIGKRTALSHTGSVAGSDAVATAVLRQAGVELVERSDELAVVSGVLATTPPVPAGRGVVVLSDGGGHATLAADALSAAGIELAELSPATSRRLRELLGPAAAVGNPVDVAGATDDDPERLAECARCLADDPCVGMVLVVGLFGGYHLRFDSGLQGAENLAARRLAELAGTTGIPLLVQSLYEPDRPENHAILRASGVQVLASIDHAVRATIALYRRGRYLSTMEDRGEFRVSLSAAEGGQEVRPLDEPSGRYLLEEAGIDLGPWRLVRSARDAEAAVAAFGGPCALKVVSPQAVHKSDLGGVRLDVTPGTAEGAYTEIVDSLRSAVPDAEITGVLVGPMAPRGVELLVGATVDPIFGPVVAFGSGGILVEALRDVTFRAVPFSALEAKEMIQETLVSRLLSGHRTLPAVDLDALSEFLVMVGNFVATTPELAELDLNPAIASGSSIRPVDVRVVISDS